MNSPLLAKALKFEIMKMKNIIYILVLTLTLASCESMEDTYSEFNTPKERYVGKVKNVTIEQGWKRFRLHWTNSEDAAVVNIKVKWEDQNGVADSAMLSPDTEMYVTDTVFSNQNYKFSVTSVDSRNHESFPVEVYADPYTETSTAVEMFKVVEKKYFFVENQLFLMLYEVGKNIYDVSVHYTSEGTEKTMHVDKEDFENGIMVVENLTAASEVSIQGKMMIPGCFDSITVPPYVLDPAKKNYSGSFIGNMRLQLDMLNISNEQLDTLTTLYVDYSTSTLEDILYLPNLKKVVLGKKRMNSTASNITSTTYVSKLEDINASVFALRKMHELKGLEVEIYGNQFLIADSLDFEKQYAKNTPPDVRVPHDVDQWELSINAPEYYENENPENNHPYVLQDLLGKRYYDWESIQLNDELKTHEITYNMKEVKSVKGFQFYQSTSTIVRYNLPSRVEIHISVDGDNWETAFFQATLDVGGVPGEATIAYMREPKEAQFIKLIVKDIERSNNNFVVVDEFVPIL